VSNTVIHEAFGKLPALNLSGRMPELDGLRGIAIGMVLIWHLYFGTVEPIPGSALAYLHALGRMAWSGVDLFFVLSGFLIGGILLDNREATNYFKVFYTRRFFRIIPAYMLCVCAVYVLMRLVENRTATRLYFLSPENALPWTPHFFFLQNFWMAARNTWGVLAITWSLCIEEQFYLTLPWLVRFLSPRRLTTTVCAVILAAPVFRIALILLWPGHRLAGYVLLCCRADALMLGVLGAIALRNPRCKAWFATNRAAMRGILVVLAFGVLLLERYSFFVTSIGMQTVGYTWLAFSYLCVLLYALTVGKGWLGGFLRWKPLGWLGTHAYGLYLYHIFVNWIVFGTIYAYWPRIRDLRSLGVSFLALFILLVLSRISWLYFEKPLLRLGHRTQYQFDAVAGAPPSVLEGGGLSSPQVARP
jgi:peptidoglycan/LPS O-acetylase OafA/YrhL